MLSKRDLGYNASFTASNKPIYSASVDEAATEFCLFVFQQIKLEF